MGDCGICEIIDLRRYPVKSMLGESLTTSEVGSRGLAGDRTHALVLPRDVRALRVLADYHRIVPLPGLGEQPCAGVYAEPVRIGRVRLGDHVRLIDP